MKQQYIKIAILIILLAFVVYISYSYIWDTGVSYHDYIVLKPVIPNTIDQGGFAWHLHHVQCLIQLCEMTGKIPVIYFDKGYYYSKAHGSNWWNYFFVPLISDKITSKVVSYGDRYGYHQIESLPLEDKVNKPYLYTNVTFQKVLRPIPGDFQKIYQKIRLNNQFRRKIDNFRSTHFKNYWMIGIHYRGTDKFASFNDNEDLKENRHFHYDQVVTHLKRHISKLHKDKSVAIFVASDEEPFVQKIKQNFSRVISYNSSRSMISTSGLSLDTKKCVAGSTSKECLKLKKLQEASIHRGNNKITPYKKGNDAVMDIWLLSSCDELFRTHLGNFSGQPGRINPGLKVYSL